MKYALAFALMLIAPAAAITDWRAEPAMTGVQYVGRVPADGELMVQGWRNDGGDYVDENYFALSVYSQPNQIGISIEKFRYREADGAAAWTIAKFMSYPGLREKIGVNFDCGMGAGFAGRMSNTETVVAIVEFGKIPADKELFHDGVLAAAKVDLKTGAIEPIPPDGVSCIQTLDD